MKKKVLIMMPSMFIGGAERSLLGLLEAFDYEKVDVSLFLYRHEGEFLHDIPAQVRLLPEMERYRTFDVPIRSLLLSRRFPYGFIRLLSKVAIQMHCKLTHEKYGVWMSMQYTARFLQPLLPKIPGDYDIGIMFLGVADTLIHKVQARVRVAWNHTDYDTLYPNHRMDLQTYSKVDYLVSVSEASTKKVIEHYPQLGEKAITIENILPVQFVREQAKEKTEGLWRDRRESILLSIGRYCNAKNFDNVPDICRRLLDAGLAVKWYLIGYGGDEPLIRDKIAEAGMQEHVILLGKKENPYPYIKACDLYVQPSRYEGKCVTVREAQILGKPVVITNYATSASQLEDGVDGVIVPMDNEGCAAGIAALLLDPEKMRQLSENCQARDYSNAQEVGKIAELIKST